MSAASTLGGQMLIDARRHDRANIDRARERAAQYEVPEERKA